MRSARRKTPTTPSRGWRKPDWDAALVDIKMHGTDGIELQRRMHEIEPELIVIMMTGYASVEDGGYSSEEWRLRLRYQAARSG